jgi:hypothetical protein
MKKLIVFAIAMLLAVPVFADFDGINNTDNSTNQSVSQNTNFTASNRSENRNDNRSSSNSISSSNQVQGQSNTVAPEQSTTVGGDTNKNTAYVMTAPNTVAGQGQQAASLYSIFGGINTAESSEYSVCIEKIRVISQMNASGLIDKELAKEEALEALAQLKDASKPKRVLGFLWKTRGVHLLNGCGLLATDACEDFNIDKLGEFLTSPLK